eukprot:scaffold140852_cov48-Attheya_sp.AAC.1
MAKSIENIMEIMGEHNLDDHGSFVTDLQYLGEVKDQMDSFNDLMGKSSVRNGDDNTVEMYGEMRNAMGAAIKPLQIMLDHTKDPMSVDECSSWNETKLLGFLQEHKFDPFPVPSKEVLVALVNEMRAFVMACMHNIDTMPDNDEFAALGAQAMGHATPKDAKIIEKMNAPIKREELMMVEPQIPLNFRLHTIEEWIPAYMPKFEDSFKILRGEWCIRQNIPQDRSVLHHEVLQTFENIAYTFDYMVENPGKDMLATIQIFKGTESEQALAVRPLGASIMRHHQMGGIKFATPVILVEWHLTKKVDGGIRKAQQFAAGLRKGTQFQPIVPENLEEFELVVELLKENRKALHVKNETLLLEKHCTDKSWKFSVICPADPNRKGFVRYCPVCQKRATNNCSRCGAPIKAQSTLRQDSPDGSYKDCSAGSRSCQGQASENLLAVNSLTRKQIVKTNGLEE